MRDKLFVDTNVLLYLLSDDEHKKSSAEDMQHGLVIDGQLKVVNPFN